MAIDERAAAAAAADHLRALGPHAAGGALAAVLARGPRGPAAARRAARAPGHARAARGLRRRRRARGAVNDRAHGERAAGALLDGADPPTGLLCMSDELAIGALQAARARGLDVPRELSVVGWDDTPEARRADPPLTTIRQSLRDQGRRCAELAAAGARPRSSSRSRGNWLSGSRQRAFRLPCVNARMGSPASADIELGARVVDDPAAARGRRAGTSGTVVGEAGWIQRRWRVRFDDGPCVDVPEYALDRRPGTGRFRRAQPKQPKGPGPFSLHR